MNHKGIDVSGKALNVVVSVNGKHRRAQLYENTPEVILTQTKSLIGTLEEQIASFRTTP